MFKSTWYEGEGDDMQRVSAKEANDVAFCTEFNNEQFLRVAVCDVTDQGLPLPAPHVVIEVEGNLYWEGYIDDLKDLLKRNTQQAKSLSD
jgi:hypothetical protein